MPQFAHLPLLLKPEGSGKLSKRDGDRLGFPVFPLQWTGEEGNISAGYRESGYLPEAVINFLALLGWNPGDDTEVMSMDELISKFDLAHCSKSGAKFDFEKGKWFNHKYIQMCDDERLARLCMPFIEKAELKISETQLMSVLPLVKERLTLLPDVVDQVRFFFVAPTEYDEKGVKKRWKADSPKHMNELITLLESDDNFEASHLEAVISEWIASKEYGVGAVMNAIRLCLVGAPMGPHIYDIMEVLGKKETIERLKNAVERLPQK